MHIQKGFLFKHSSYHSSLGYANIWNLAPSKPWDDCYIPWWTVNEWLSLQPRLHCIFWGEVGYPYRDPSSPNLNLFIDVFISSLAEFFWIKSTHRRIIDLLQKFENITALVKSTFRKNRCGSFTKNWTGKSSFSIMHN